MSNNNDVLLSEIEELKSKSTAALAKHINFYGLNFSESRLFSLMFLEDKPMTLDDMSYQLGMSKTSMSTGIRSLEDVEMVEQTWKRGIRKDLYKSDEDLYSTFSSVYLEKWFSLIKNNRKTFNMILRDIKSIITKVDYEELELSLNSYSNNINSILQFYNWLESMLLEMKKKIDDMDS